VVFNWPRLEAESLRDQYDGDYYVFNLPPARRWARAAQLYLEYLRPLEDQPHRRLLEVGCARGDLLALASHRGWNGHGVEISPQAARLAVTEHNLPVDLGTLESRREDLGLFDVVIATDVIEHVPSPRPFLEAIRQTLRPGGIAILETPNFGSLWRRLAGPYWIGLNRFHLFLFSASSLLRLMRDCGFHACRASSTTHTAYTHWGNRPEIDCLVRHLPAGLRWRAQRGLNQATPTGLGADLWRNPPQSLDEACDRIASCSSKRSRWSRFASLAGDNLAVTGQA
jgi:2-polyprenyl-3-methyl-5-hydroxy-6-metoxy-1,4-benzoquinol methylase